MQAQLQRVVDEFEQAQARLHALADALPTAQWAQAPAPARWSVAQNVDHLNRTGAAFVPVLRTAITEARALGTTTTGRYRRDPLGWMLSQIMPPPVRVMRVPTGAGFIPEPGD